jgi:hypothetical protein
MNTNVNEEAGVPITCYLKSTQKYWAIVASWVKTKQYIGIVA